MGHSTCMSGTMDLHWREMIMNVQVREATEDDVAETMPLFVDLYRGDLGEHFVEILTEYVTVAAHCVLVAIRKDRIVGVLVGSYRLDIDYECRAGFVDAVIVDKDCRGQGIGKTLLRSFADWAAAKGCTAIQVMNARPHFFESIGFQERPCVLHQVSPATLSASPPAEDHVS